MHIEVGTLRQYISVAVADILSLIVSLPDIKLTTAVGLVADYAPVCLGDNDFTFLCESRKVSAYQNIKIFMPIPYVPKSSFCLKTHAFPECENGRCTI